jgi:hypothetical protein
MPWACFVLLGLWEMFRGWGGMTRRDGRNLDKVFVENNFMFIYFTRKFSITITQHPLRTLLPTSQIQVTKASPSSTTPTPPHPSQQTPRPPSSSPSPPTTPTQPHPNHQHPKKPLLLQHPLPQHKLHIHILFTAKNPNQTILPQKESAKHNTILIRYADL